MQIDKQVTSPAEPGRVTDRGHHTRPRRLDQACGSAYLAGSVPNKNSSYFVERISNNINHQDEIHGG